MEQYDQENISDTTYSEENTSETLIVSNKNNLVEYEMKKNLNTSFSVEFHDGYSFKYLLDYLKETGNSVDSGGNFVFTQKGIRYSQSNVDNTILNTFLIFGKELCEYVFKSDNDEYIVGCSFEDICPVTKGIGKKDKFKMYKCPDQRYVYFYSVKNNAVSSSTGVTTILPKNIKYKKYLIDESLGKFDEPIVTITTSEFKNMCEEMLVYKSTYISVQGTKDKVTFISGNGTAANRFREFGKSNRSFNINKYNNMDIIHSKRPGPNLRILPESSDYIHKIRSSIIKSLAKLNNLSERGTVKIFMNENAIKLQSHIGTYGILETYLRSCS